MERLKFVCVFQAADMSLLIAIGVFLAISSSSASSATRALSCSTRGADLDPDAVLASCPPDCGRGPLTVFGAAVYADISSVCGAALHSGAAGHAGGEVRVQRLPGRRSYVGSFANGVQSRALSRRSSSFRVSGPKKQRPQELIRHSAAATKEAVKKMPVKKVGNKACQMDIAVVIDSSANLGRRRFNQQKNFVAKLAAMLKVGVDGPRVALVQASDVPRTEFLLSNYTQPKELQFAIKELRHLGGETNTGKAITHTAENVFTPQNGARHGRPRVMLVLVDGWPSDDPERAAAAAREAGINVFVAPVTKPAPDEILAVPDLDFAKKAVCRDNGFFSYQIPSWFGTTKHVKPLAQRLCSPDALLCSRTCLNSVNVVFLIDGSSSMGDPNFRSVLDFAAAIAGRLEVSDVGARVGAVQFTYDQRLEFGLSEHGSKEDVVAALKRISYMSGGTATGGGIAYAAQNVFRRAAAGRNFLVVVTDGQSYDNVAEPALMAHNQGIVIFSVGVAWAPAGDLRAMASSPKEEHTFFSRHFEGLEDLVDDVVRGICRDFSASN
ncbi:cochlin isoform X5 [Syngnathoides biaculeatus]|uniref:cochlin isoform X5 n=1 Tax=Syngnathoides biaculeatus TaxID=300417 RepID=UPI002ADE657E|nr:cochlin isoform X5 [Syngnathoides biaculeatus]